MIAISRWKIIAVAASIVFGIIFALPNMLPPQTLAGLPGWLPHQTLNLGLDLRGGSHLLLEVDRADLRRKTLESTLEDVQNTLRQRNIAFTDLADRGGEITVRITDAGRVSDAQTQLRQILGPLPGSTDPGIEISVIGDQRLRLRVTESLLNARSRDAANRSIEIIRNRIDPQGVLEPTIVLQGGNRIVVQVPGDNDPARLQRLIGQTARLTFQMVDDTITPQELAAGDIPAGSVLLPMREGGGGEVVRRRVIVNGDMLTRATQDNDPRTREPVVAFRFNAEGARAFGQATSRNVGKRFAIILDDRVISAPVINEPITGGSGIISGSFTTESANDLAVLLEAGALPVRLTVEEQRTVGPGMGADAVEAGRVSTAIAFVAILVFMLLAYGFIFGGISVVALLVNGLLIIAVMSVTRATLTLPGIAGLILTLAVAVDANVLIYERIRDEIRAGRSIVSAIDAGFNRAMTTIIDANLTTLLAAVIMFYFGAGPVRGFAWTLSIGVFTSVFTAVFVTQVLLAWWYRATRPKSLPIV